MFRSSKVPLNGSPGFEVPSRPTPLLSPPETEPEPPSDIPHGQVETPASRFRRVIYNTGGLLNRESKLSPSQKQSKWLIMVIPPASLAHEPPVLGHTLSSGPVGRFSNGILMPLFSTLYGQLTALAREFNMPSTTGLCVYLHIQENGVPLMTPRISDETWQILWGHYFSADDRAPSYPSHGLPISGKIEFDIDLRRAKWFNAWMGIGPRERAESEYRSREPSVVHTHWRGDSRGSLFLTEQGGEESPSPPEATPTANVPFPRQKQVPRPLFLEKRDASLRSLPRHPSREQNLSSEAHIPPEPAFVPNTLSPKVQELEEPQPTEKADLDSIVRQWRASSVAGGSTSAAVAAGQPSLDPINMPPGADIELDFDDFAWSISSAGPPLESALSPNWPSPLPSIHIAERVAGSVCLTPTTCTSWGPPNYPDSPVSCASRRPSVDLGHRMMEYVPMTPSTATTWGPEDLPSPTFSLYRAPSIDLGRRNMGSVPATPSTATTWGPPDSPLIMPATPPYIRTPDAGERAFSDFQSQAEQRTVTSALGFPYYDAWTAEPWRHVWPYQSFLPLEIACSPVSEEFHHETTRDLHTSRSSLDVKLTLDYPTFDIYPAVYPYNLASLYPSTSRDHGNLEAILTNSKNPCSVNYPFFDIYPPTYILPGKRAFSDFQSQAEQRTVTSALGFPYYDAWTAEPWRHVWPYQSYLPLENTIACSLVSEEFHHETTRDLHTSRSSLDVKLSSDYPTFDIYPAVYPYNLMSLYPLTSQDHGNLEAIPVSSKNFFSANYPFFDIYPAVYPNNLNYIYIYPAHASILSKLIFKEHRLLPEYPDFTALYPIDPFVERAGLVKAQPATLQGTIYDYPYLTIYPPIYPFNVQANRIYTPKACEHAGGDEEVLPVMSESLRTDLERANDLLPIALPKLNYPNIVIYPSVYPFNLHEIYPSCSVARFRPVRTSPLPEYPDFAGLYPPNSIIKQIWWNTSPPVSLVAMSYPNLVIYASVYPYSVYEIYGGASIEQLSSNAPSHYRGNPRSEPECSGTKGVNINFRPLYPLIQIYEPAYPHIIIYPSVVNDHAHLEALPTLYPTVQIYKPAYPHFDIYPPVQLQMNKDILLPSTRLKAAYPVLDIYDPVYPHLVIYPEVSLRPAVHRQSLNRKRTPTPGPGRQRMSRILQLHPSESGKRMSRSTAKRPLPPLPATKPTHELMSADDGHFTKLTEDMQHDVQPRRKSRKSHFDLHMMIFGPQEEQTSTANIPKDLPPTYNSRRKPRKTHHDLHLMVLGEKTEATSNEMFPRPPVSVIPAIPSRQRSRSGTVSQRPTNASVPPTMTVPQIPSSVAVSHTRTPPLSRMNSSSSTTSPMTSRAGPTPSPILDAESPSSSNTRRPLSVKGLPSSPSQSRSSVLELPPTRVHSLSRMNSSSPTASLMTSQASPTLSPIIDAGSPSSPNTLRPLSVRGLPSSPSQSRSSVLGLPSPSPYPHLLTRVRSMNTLQRPPEKALNADGRGLDRSKSMSRLSRSTVQDRARLFSGSSANAGDTERKHASSRPVIHKLDRAKLPFS